MEWNYYWFQSRLDPVRFKQTQIVKSTGHKDSQKQKNEYLFCSCFTLFRMSFFGTAQGWEGGVRQKGLLFLKLVTHIQQLWNLPQLYIT